MSACVHRRMAWDDRPAWQCGRPFPERGVIQTQIWGYTDTDLRCTNNTTVFRPGVAGTLDETLIICMSLKRCVQDVTLLRAPNVSLGLEAYGGHTALWHIECR
jgi:hypothetical protein